MEKYKFFIPLILGILLIISLCFNVHYYKMLEKTGIDTTTTILVRTDTIKDTIPQIKYINKVAVIKDTLKINKIVRDTLDEKQNDIAKDTNSYAIVDIPITQKVYSDDSTYTAYVSGYKQKLDSINVYQKTITIDRTITITKKDAKRWSVGPVIYGGYDFQSRNIGYGVGIGITYGIFRW